MNRVARRRWLAILSLPTITLMITTYPSQTFLMPKPRILRATHNLHTSFRTIELLAYHPKSLCDYLSKCSFFTHLLSPILLSGSNHAAAHGCPFRPTSHGGSAVGSKGERRCDRRGNDGLEGRIARTRKGQRKGETDEGTKEMPRFKEKGECTER